MFLNEGVLSIISIIIPVYTQMCALWLVEDRFTSREVIMTVIIIDDNK